MGGQRDPNSTLGESLLWKKVQKKEMKKKTSEIMNKIIPQRIFKLTFKVWIPWKVLSRITSRHHWIMERIMIVNPMRMNQFNWNSLNHLVILNIKIIVPRALVRGQGLKFTKWKGWLWWDVI
jgi:hypothetical protein